MNLPASRIATCDACGEPFPFSGPGRAPACCEHCRPRPTGATTREQQRSRRKRAVRARTVSVKRMTKRELELGRLLYPDTGEQRPRTRAECERGARPCPFVSCFYHLYLDVSPRTGAIKLNFPDLEVDELEQSCALDVADRGGTTLEDVGAIVNLTRERIRQLEVHALAKVDPRDLRDFAAGVGTDGKRHLPLLQLVEGGPLDEWEEP